jgi:hypothetical protein
MSKLTNERMWRGDYLAKKEREIMPILDTSSWNWGENVEPELIPAGDRATMKIVRVVERETMNGRKYLAIAFESLDHPNADDVYEQFYFLSDSTLTQKERNRETRKWFAFKQCFELHLPEHGQTRTEDWIGMEGRVEIGQKPDRQKGVVNNISEYLMAGGDNQSF